MTWLDALLPPVTRARAKRFIEDGRSGQIVLEVLNGRVLKAHFTDHVRETTEDVSYANGRLALDRIRKEG